MLFSTNPLSSEHLPLRDGVLEYLERRPGLASDSDRLIGNISNKFPTFLVAPIRNLRLIGEAEPGQSRVSGTLPSLHQ